MKIHSLLGGVVTGYISFPSAAGSWDFDVVAVHTGTCTEYLSLIWHGNNASSCSMEKVAMRAFSLYEDKRDLIYQSINLLPLPSIRTCHSSTQPPTLYIPLGCTPRSSPVLRKIIVAKVSFFEIVPALAKRFLLAVCSSLSV